METEIQLAKRVIGFAMKVHGKLGPGFSERVNQNALVIECERAGLSVEAFSPISVSYEGVVVGEFIADMIIRDSGYAETLLIEIKSVSALNPAHSKQLVNYLAATGIDNGLLLNFGAASLEFRTKTRLYRPPQGEPNLRG
jgi:GxxExxY protein